VSTSGVQSGNAVRFGPFAADLSSGELRKYGAPVRLGGQPAQILRTLLEKPGEIVTREELRRRLWADDTFVEFDNGLNNALKKLRSALGDSAGEPLYIETLPRVGYRFIAPIERERRQERDRQESSANVSAPIAADGHRGSRIWRWASAIAVAAAILIAYGFWSSPPVPHATDFVERPVTEHLDGFGRIVTDGVRVFFPQRSGDRDTVVQTSTAGGPTTPVETPFRNTRIFDISADRSEFLIGNFETRRPGLPLWIWPVQGGSPIRIGNVIADDATWSPDGQRVFYTRGGEIHVTGRDGSGDRTLIRTDGLAYWIRFSPDGSKITYSVDSNDSDAQTLWEASADGSNPHQKFPGWSNPPAECCADWTPDGGYFIFTSRHAGFANIWAIREGRSWLHWRAPVPVQLAPTARALARSVLTRNGTRAFVSAWNEESQYERYDFASKGFRPFTATPGALAALPSEDGTKTAVLKSDWTLWRTKGDGSAALQLTEAPLQVSQPRWSPDGRLIAFEAHRFGKPVRAYAVSADGGPIQEIFALQGEQSVPAWSPDGTQIALAMNVDSSADGSSNRGIYIVDWKTRRGTRLENSEGLTAPMWSPDGRYFVAKTLDESAVLLFDWRARTWRPIASGNGLSGLTWSRDSRYLYVQRIVEEGQPIYRLRAGDFKPERLTSFEAALKEGFETCVLQSGTADGSLIVRMRNSGGQIYALDLNFP
jgi:Tol biopolymer transport system component/DNA-binding winged helix-turn-helix (wHTH) protein